MKKTKQKSFDFKRLINNLFIGNILTSKFYPNEDLFPYTCYYNKNTILTQNNEILQIIKIPSFLETKTNNLVQLRNDIIRALQTTLDNSYVNFYVTTVRKQADIVQNNQVYTNQFAKNIMETWNDYNQFSSEYVNEIYITVILCEKNNNNNFFLDLIQNYSLSKIKKEKHILVNKMTKELTSIVEKMMSILINYKPYLLSIVKIDEYLYSDHCQFFSTIINNDNRLFPLDINNLGYGLGNKKVVYGSNLIQTISKTHKNDTFYAIISLKNFSDLLLSTIDKLTQVNQEIIITQSLTIANNLEGLELYLKDFSDQLTMLDDDEIREELNINELIEDCSIKKDNLNYFISQTLVQIKGKTIEELEKNVLKFIKLLKNLGIVCVREEMFLPTLFWSQLPGNFDFIKRYKIINKDEIAQFASLCNFPIGNIQNPKFGDALILLKTALKNPYFFSFYSRIGNNTLIVGNPDENRTKILNFLTLSATKQFQKIYYIDTLNKSKILINALNGKYYEISKNKAPDKLKMVFPLFTNNENNSFLDVNIVLKLLNNIIKFNDDGMVKLGNKKTDLETEIKKFNELFIKNYKTFKNFRDFLMMIYDNNLTMIYGIFYKFCNPEEYGFMFYNNIKENIFNQNSIIGFDLSTCIDNDLITSMTTFSLLKSIYENANDQNVNTLICINELWNLFDNKYLNEFFYKIIPVLNRKNITIIGTTKGSQFFENSFLKDSVRDLFPINFLLRNIKTNIYQKKIFDISDQESKMLSVIKKDSGTFLIRHERNMIFASIQFNFLSKTQMTILECNHININIMNKAKKETSSENSELWLLQFEEIFEKYNKMKYEQKLKDQEERQIKWQESRAQINMEQING